MREIEKVSHSKNYTAVSLGSLDKLMDYSFIHPKSKQELKGKVFLKGATEATGTEISFQLLPPNTGLPFFHSHAKNEETYIILKGRGDFKVDEDIFHISEGSIVRVAPKGMRGLRNTSNTPMIYMVIQSEEGSLSQFSSGDSGSVSEPKW